MCMDDRPNRALMARGHSGRPVADDDGEKGGEMTRPIGWMRSTDKGVRMRRVVVCATLGAAAVLLLAATSKETTAAAPRAPAVSLVQLASTQKLEAKEEANQQMATQVDKEADESEFWSDGKVRKVLGRMLRAMAAMDLRVTSKFNHEDAAIKKIHEGEASSGGGDAAELTAVRNIEKRLSAEMKVQGKVSALESGQEKKEASEMHDDHAEMMSGVEEVQKKQEELESELQSLSHKEEETGPEAVLAVLQTLGIQKYLDEWCNEGKNCRQGLDGVLEGTLYARRDAGVSGGQDKWRCYTAKSLVGGSYKGGGGYCTADMQLSAIVKRHLGSRGGQASADLLKSKVEGFDGKLSDIEEQVGKVGDSEEGLQEEEDVKLAALRAEQAHFRHQLLNVTTSAARQDQKVQQLSAGAGLMATRMTAMTRVEAEQERSEMDAVKKDVASVIPQVKRLFVASDAQVKAVSSRVSNLASLEAKEDKKLSGEAAAAEKAATKRERITVSVSGTRDEKLRIEPATAKYAAPEIKASDVPAVRSAAHSSIVASTSSAAATTSPATTSARNPALKVPSKAAVAIHPVVAVKPAVTPGAAAASKGKVSAPAPVQAKTVAAKTVAAKTVAAKTVAAKTVAAKLLQKPRHAHAAKVLKDKEHMKDESKAMVQTKTGKTPCLVHMSKYVKDFTPDSPAEC